MGKTTDIFKSMKSWLPQTYHFKPKLMLQENARVIKPGASWPQASACLVS